MCTLTWFTHQDGYELFFNRDESVLRKRATKPSLARQNGVSYIAPTDADAGGTWIAVNHLGYTVCLLNHYQFEQIKTYKPWVSRGELVRSFADTSSLRSAHLRFIGLDLHDFRAFRMFIIAPDGGNRLFVWDGHGIRVEVDVTQPKSSSAVDSQHVKAMRRQSYHAQGLSTSQLRDDFIDFHRSHYPHPSKESVCMHRTEAQTVSLSHICVNAQTATFAYADGPPCESELGEPLSLSLLDARQSTVSAPDSARRRNSVTAS